MYVTVSRDPQILRPQSRRISGWSRRHGDDFSQCGRPLSIPCSAQMSEVLIQDHSQFMTWVTIATSVSVRTYRMMLLNILKDTTEGFSALIVSRENEPSESLSAKESSQNLRLLK